MDPAPAVGCGEAEEPRVKAPALFEHEANTVIGTKHASPFLQRVAAVVSCYRAGTMSSVPWSLLVMQLETYVSRTSVPNPVRDPSSDAAHLCCQA